MWWMSIVGPVLIALIWLSTAWRDRRRELELETWRRTMGPRGVAEKKPGAARAGKKASDAVVGAKLVSALPGPLQRIVDAAGGGRVMGHYELVPKLAYLSAMAADAMSGSDFHAVVGKLEEDAPSLVVSPIPIIEGERAPNTGLEFKKDPDFMALFQVDAVIAPPAAPRPGSKEAKSPPKPLTDAERAKKIRAFLSRPVRDALRDFPDAWLYVQDRAMALVAYGPADASKLSELVTVADVIFAEYGADGGPSLFGDDEDEADDVVDSTPPPKQTKPPTKSATAKG